MFLACPHCGYLVALIVAKDGPARDCPRCGRPLQGEAAGADAGEDAATAKDDAGSVAESPTAAANEAATAAAPANPAHGVAAAASGDEISRSLRRAGTAETPAKAAREEASGHASAADAQATAHPAAAATDAATQSAADPAHDDAPAASADTPADTTESTQSSDAGNAAALRPLTAAAATAAAPARGRRQRKSETTVTSARRAPSFARQQARAQAPKPRLHWSGPAAIVALAAALALQLLLAQRAELAADARWRPLVSGVCGVLGCSVPAWHEPATLTMLDRNVLPVAERAGVLRVSAGFRNDARWAQPWPVLVLSLEDVDGRRVGQRAFAPQEYRRGYRPGELIAPGQSAAVQFEVVEPAPRVVAFTFDFR
ncbi:DUF3426 domain-containing protein [Lysobacter enzymogenes]|uniref:DUF3426 domain-containing protein n=1 Tax=Lysobacter enzymogenes TaxID=69 RepID=UPI001A96DA42|nr:DUF3426 domain-containing protein [Lysobacter enzymogenes]QQP95577.1 DUF3426 domain-containing protein [Lysobacter enzymogenes]